VPVVRDFLDSMAQRFEKHELWKVRQTHCVLAFALALARAKRPEVKGTRAGGAYTPLTPRVSRVPFPIPRYRCRTRPTYSLSMPTKGWKSTSCQSSTASFSSQRPVTRRCRTRYAAPVDVGYHIIVHFHPVTLCRTAPPSYFTPFSVPQVLAHRMQMLSFIKPEVGAGLVG
jgi:hypothetical protein